MAPIAPTISAIVPIYNHAAYLAEALESVIAQTFTDWELLIVDDGSQDGSFEIAEAFRARDPERIRLVAHPDLANNGIAATYQLGISLAKGRYVAFLESDDLWSANYLAEKAAIFQSHPRLGVVFSPCEVLTDGWFGRDMAWRQRVLQARLPNDRPFSNFRTLLRKNNVATFSAFVARTDLLAGLRVPEDSRLIFYDWWVLLHLSLLSDFYFDAKSRTTWRHHPKSLLGRQTMEEHKTRLIEFFDLQYQSAGESIGAADEPKRALFESMNAARPKFQAFYARPSLATFVPFYAAAKLWAVESLLSYWVNSWKFADSAGTAHSETPR